MTLRWILVPVLAFAVAACAPVGSYRNDQTRTETFEPITVRVSGFGTYENVQADRSIPASGYLLEGLHSWMPTGIWQSGSTVP